LDTCKTEVQAVIPTGTLDMTALGLGQQPREVIAQASTMLMVSENRWSSFLKLRAFAMEFSRQMNLPDIMTSTDEMKCSFRASNYSNVVEIDVSLAGDRFCISSQIYRISGSNKEELLYRVHTDELCRAFLSLGSLVQQENSFMMRLSVTTDDLNYSEFRDTLESFCDTCEFVRSILED
jgi:hypothetical protein